MNEPDISVGILHAEKIELFLNGDYSAKGQIVSGRQTVEFHEGGILWNDNHYQELMFSPLADEAEFSLDSVVIGKDFHWERKETQAFGGQLKIIIGEGKLWGVNILPIEQYLESVISSEMNATSSLEFLKAHAVISRSWVMAQIEKRMKLGEQIQENAFFSYKKTDNELVRWYDREDHTLFDVCADDHCQRYQGKTKISNPAVVEAVKATRGIVLYDGDDICDARFSKCCGGVSERFDTCWEDTDKPYLQPVRDAEFDDILPDLTDEEEARRWILGSPDSLCNADDKAVISQILNGYDQETTDFFRWEVTYTQKELTELISQNLKEDLGEIIGLIPVERGASGRISRLKIVGTKKSFTIGKELEIRKVLSTSHLFSSAFVVDQNQDTFTLHGAGWGHGVGLCQIGAAVMGERGYDYKQILSHYYRDADLKQMY